MLDTILTFGSWVQDAPDITSQGDSFKIVMTLSAQPYTGSNLLVSLVVQESS